MPGPLVNIVNSTEKMPTEVDVVIIGGGIIGTSTALELAERGISVALCEKGQIAHEQSSRNWGWVRIARRDPRELALMAESLKIWQTLDNRLQRPTGYRQTGLIFSCRNEKSYQIHHQACQQLQEMGLDAKMLSVAEVANKLPHNHQVKLQGALYSAVDGCAEPQWVTSAIAQRTQELGGSILTNCAVRGIERSAGKINEVITEHGSIKCHSVVVAAGAWSSLWLASLGISLPQLKVLNSVARSEPITTDFKQVFWDDDFAIRPRSDGGYTIASGTISMVDIVPDSFRYFKQFTPTLLALWSDLSLRFGSRFFTEAKLKRKWALDDVTIFEQCRVLDPKPNERVIKKFLSQLQQNFPSFSQTVIAQSWAGYIDVTPDAIPVISPIDEIPGLFLATGFSGHGFGIAPAAGRLMADLVTGNSNLVNPSDFSFKRFSDGSKLRIIAGF